MRGRERAKIAAREEAAAAVSARMLGAGSVGKNPFAQADAGAMLAESPRRRQAPPPSQQAQIVPQSAQASAMRAVNLGARFAPTPPSTPRPASKTPVTTARRELEAFRVEVSSLRRSCACAFCLTHHGHTHTRTVSP